MKHEICQETKPDTNRPSSVMCAVKSTLQVAPATMKSLLKPIHKGLVDLCDNARKLQSKKCLLNAGAGPNLVKKAILKIEFLMNIKIQQLPRLRSAQKTLSSSLKKFIYSQRSATQAFEFGLELVVGVLRELSSYTDIFEEYFQARKMVPFRSSPVSILTRCQSITLPNYAISVS